MARASFEELLLDYEDYIRHRHKIQWEPGSPEALAVRGIHKKISKDQPDQPGLTDRERRALYAHWLEHNDPMVRANALICLIHQANYLLDQQIAATERQFVEKGGYSEQLAAARLEERERKRNNRADQADRPGQADRIPACPKCGKTMVLRTVKRGQNSGERFWGCSAYPECKGTAPG